jgi:hypothetical protein
LSISVRLSSAWASCAVILAWATASTVADPLACALSKSLLAPRKAAASQITETASSAPAAIRPTLSTRLVRPRNQRDARNRRKPTPAPTTTATITSGRPVAWALAALRLVFSAAYRSLALVSSVRRMSPDASRR